MPDNRAQSQRGSMNGLAVIVNVTVAPVEEARTIVVVQFSSQDHVASEPGETVKNIMEPFAYKSEYPCECAQQAVGYAQQMAGIGVQIAMKSLGDAGYRQRPILEPTPAPENVKQFGPRS